MISTNKLGFPILIGLMWAFMVVATMIGFAGFTDAAAPHRPQLEARSGVQVGAVSVSAPD